VEAGWFDEEACRAFEAVCARPDRIAVCSKCIDCGLLETVRRAFEAAGSSLTKEDLTVIGSKCLKEGLLDDAHQAFKEVDSKEDLLAVG
jgi:hypothetical protein